MEELLRTAGEVGLLIIVLSSHSRNLCSIINYFMFPLSVLYFFNPCSTIPFHLFPPLLSLSSLLAPRRSTVPTCLYSSFPSTRSCISILLPPILPSPFFSSFRTPSYKSVSSYSMFFFGMNVTYYAFTLVAAPWVTEQFLLNTVLNHPCFLLPSTVDYTFYKARSLSKNGE